MACGRAGGTGGAGPRDGANCWPIPFVMARLVFASEIAGDGLPALGLAILGRIALPQSSQRESISCIQKHGKGGRGVFP